MDSRPALAPHRVSRRIALAALVLTASGVLAAPPSLQTVRLMVGDGSTSVILSADGALPSPKVGVLSDPPRIYLDFPGVTAATEGIRADGDLRVRGVRVAVNQSRPLVTRVVIDLARPAPHRIEAGLSASGHFTIVVGVPAALAGAATPRPARQGAAEGAPVAPTPPPAEPPKAVAPEKAPAAAPTVPVAPPAALRPPMAGEPATRAAGATDARALPLATRPSLRTVRVIDVGNGEATVFLSADGALPSPKVGVLTDPPSVYLDFPDIAAATEGIRVEGNLLVRGVRVAVNQSRPLVTRVVIDLARPAPHRIEAGLRDAGDMRVVVGVPGAPAGAQTPRPRGQDVADGAPVLPTPPPAEPPKAAAPEKAPAAVPAVSAAPEAVRPPPSGERAARTAGSPESARAAGATAARAPAKDVAQYLPRTSALLERLERLRPLLQSLDALAALPAGQLKSAAQEFESIRQALAAIVPPRTLAPTHELFRDLCVLGAASVAARVAPATPDDSTRAWNAAAAAAGAIMFLDRVRAELGLAPEQEVTVPGSLPPQGGLLFLPAEVAAPAGYTLLGRVNLQLGSVGTVKPPKGLTVYVYQKQ
jgi:hypothetical protein